MDNYTNKAAERLLGRLVPPAAMGEKRADEFFPAGPRGPLGLREDAQLGDAAPALGAVGGAGIGALMGGKRNALLRMLQGAAIGGGTGLGMHWTSGGRDLLGQPAEGLGPIAGGLGLAGLLQLLKEDGGEENEEEAKEASARGALSPVLLKKAIENVGVQQFVPLSERREFSDKEKGDIAREKSHLFPKIFKSYKTPAVELLSSPGKQSLLAALLGGGLGAAGGAIAGMDQGGRLGGRPRFGIGSAIGAGIGGLGLGGLSALLTYFGRKQRNEDVEDLMSRLPEGATHREMLSDPVYQRDLDRAHMAAMQSGRQGGNAGLLAAALSN